MRKRRIYDIYLSTGVSDFNGIIYTALDELKYGNMQEVKYYLSILNRNLENFMNETGLYRHMKSFIKLHQYIDSFIRGCHYPSIKVEEYLYSILNSFNAIKRFVFEMLSLGL